MRLTGFRFRLWWLMGFVAVVGLVLGEVCRLILLRQTQEGSRRKSFAGPILLKSPNPNIRI